MKFFTIFSLVLSKAKAFIYSIPKATGDTGITRNRIQGMPRCKSTESIVRMQEMETSELDYPKETNACKRKTETAVHPHVELLLEATPLVVLGGLISLGN